MRNPHRLYPTKGTERPTRVLFVDTETNQKFIPPDTIKHTLRLGYAQFTRTRRGEYLRPQSEHVITNLKEFWRYVESCCPERSRLYLVSHNLHFDLPVLHAFTELPALGWELTQFYTKGMVSIYKWRKGTRHLVALDNGNYFAGKLEKWGTKIGFPKLEIDFDAASDEKLLTYCKRDVEIMVKLWRLWLEFLDAHDCGSFRMTTSSTAFNTYRHRFMSADIYIHDQPRAIDLEREGYSGGRVECWYQGELNHRRFYYIDFNSMYGSVMHDYEYPCALWRVSAGASLATLDRLLNKYCVVARVDLNTTEPHFVAKINRKTGEILKPGDANRTGEKIHHNARTVYPIGKFRTTLTTPELRLALDNDWIGKVYQLAYYERAPLFRDYVEYFYALRLQYQNAGQDGFAAICKLLINGLYGKFGQRGIHSEIIGTSEPNQISIEYCFDMDTGVTYDIISLAGNVFKFWQEGESYHSFPAIAAHVTAQTRLKLYRFYQMIPKGHCFYCDTDSLIVDDIGLLHLQAYLHPTELGKLKIEQTSDWLRIHAPKDYEMQGRSKTKGVKSDAVQIAPNEYRQLQWRKLRTMIRSGELDDYTARQVTKRLERKINFGVLAPSGLVLPFALDGVQIAAGVLPA